MNPLPKAHQTPPVDPLQAASQWARLSAAFVRSIEAIKREMRARHATDALMALDDRMLTDIGLARGEIRRVVREEAANDNRRLEPTPQPVRPPLAKTEAPAAAVPPTRQSRPTGFLPGIRMA